jgi:Ca2+-transporting ATPase
MKKYFYQYNKDEILKKFSTDENIGISISDIEYKKKKYGKNTIEIKKDISFIELYFREATSFLNLLLIGIIIFSLSIWIFTKEFEYLIDFIIIFFIFILNTTIGAYENYSSNKISKTLSKMLENKAIVLRDGKKIEINAKELFPGDIIFLNSGSKIPADCYILESKNLKVDESILTGESIYIHKKEEVIKKEIPISEQNNLLFMNTYVISGEAKAIVIKTGKNTEIGKIANSVQEKRRKENFLTEIDIASKKISYFAILLVILVAFILFIKGFNFISIFMVSSALIIGSIPEGLPAIVVFLLSKSVHKLAKQKVLIKDIGLLETLGSIDVLCTDKTGTLTENKMYVKKLFIDGKEIKNNSNLNENNLTILAKIINYVNEVNLIGSKLEGEPEDIALLEYLNKNYSLNINFNKKDIKEFEPFNSELKYSYCKLKDGLILKKGAPEVLLKNCKYILINGKKEKLVSNKLKKIENEMKKYSDEELRLIGFSYSKNNDEIFLGFCGLYDKPKENIEKTIQTLYSAGIEIKMITGDNINTAKAIAKECGFKNIKAVDWYDLENLNEEQFEKIVLTHNIFARMTPNLKEKILEILQKNGHRVAITGDGVNDSIALKQSDVGIVMGNGSDIAKESGDLILLNNDFRDIPIAIKEGRGIFHNIRKVINYLLTANLAEVLVIFISSFFGLIPFTAIQILWVNFVTDTAPALSLGLDPYPKNILHKKPNGKNEKILNSRIILLTIFISIKKLTLIFILFLLAYNLTKDLIFAQTIAFTWLVLSHFVRIAAIRFDEKINFFINKYVNYSLFVVVLIQFLIIYTPINNFFSVKPIPFIWILILILWIIIGLIGAKLISNFVNYLEKKIFKEIENY